MISGRRLVFVIAFVTALSTLGGSSAQRAVTDLGAPWPFAIAFGAVASLFIARYGILAMFSNRHINPTHVRAADLTAIRVQLANNDGQYLVQMLSSFWPRPPWEHRLAHWLGWNQLEPFYFYIGGRCMRGDRCSCGTIENVHEIGV